MNDFETREDPIQLRVGEKCRKDQREPLYTHGLQRKLVAVVRETPLSAIHLENMLDLARLGAVIMPASPGFYHDPRGIGDLIDFVVARVLDHMDVVHNLGYRWTGEEESVGG